MTADGEKKKLLVVDDTSENIDVLIGVLKDDYKIVPAKNGHICLA